MCVYIYIYIYIYKTKNCQSLKEKNGDCVIDLNLIANGPLYTP